MKTFLIFSKVSLLLSFVASSSSADCARILLGTSLAFDTPSVEGEGLTLPPRLVNRMENYLWGNFDQQSYWSLRVGSLRSVNPALKFYNSFLNDHFIPVVIDGEVYGLSVHAISSEKPQLKNTTRLKVLIYRFEKELRRKTILEFIQNWDAAMERLTVVGADAQFSYIVSCIDVFDGKSCNSQGSPVLGTHPLKFRNSYISFSLIEGKDRFLRIKTSELRGSIRADLSRGGFWDLIPVFHSDRVRIPF